MSTAEADVAAPASPRDAARAALLGRGLYPYHDGTRPRVGDQLEIQLRLANACPGRDLAKLDEMLAAIAPAQAQAVDPAAGPDPAPDQPPPDLAASLAAAVSIGLIVGEAFNLPPLSDDGVGLSCRERLDLLVDFLAATTEDEEDDEDGEDDDAHPGPAAGTGA